MLEKIGNEKSKVKNFIIKKFAKIRINTIGKWISDNAKHIGSIQENI